MPYTAEQLAVIAVVMTFGSLMQGALGFASGLFGVPMLVLCGFDQLEATVINFVSTGPQNIIGAIQLWSHLEPRELVAPTIWRFLGLPLGILALAEMRDLDPARVKQAIGGVMLVSVLLLAALKMRPRDRLPWGWTAVAFLSSGFLMGWAAIGGAPMVMYVNSLTWPAAKSRGFLFFCSAALVPAMAALLAWRFGAAMAEPALAALIVMPPVLAGLWIGLRAGHRLNKVRFRRLSYGLLVLISLGALLNPLLVRSARTVDNRAAHRVGASANAASPASATPAVQ